MIRSSDLQGKRVRSESGERLGHVFEIQVKHGRVDSLICGPSGLWQRLMRAQGGRHIAWSRVREIAEEIVVAD